MSLAYAPQGIGTPLNNGVSISGIPAVAWSPKGGLWYLFGNGQLVNGPNGTTYSDFYWSQVNANGNPVGQPQPQGSNAFANIADDVYVFGRPNTPQQGWLYGLTGGGPGAYSYGWILWPNLDPAGWPISQVTGKPLMSGGSTFNPSLYTPAGPPGGGAGGPIGGGGGSGGGPIGGGGGGGGGGSLFGNGNPNGNNGGTMNANALSQLLAAQQTQTAVNSMFSTIQPLLVAQTTAATKGGYACAILQGIAMALGSANGQAAAQGGNSQAALLVALLGSNNLSTFSTALATLDAAMQLPSATFTTQAAAYNTFLTALQTALTTQQTNALVTQLASGGGGMNLFGYLLQSQANAAFLAANPQVSSPFTTTSFDAAFSALETSFSAWMAAANTNAILASALS